MDKIDITLIRRELMNIRQSVEYIIDTLDGEKDES